MTLQGLPYVGPYSEQCRISYCFSFFSAKDHIQQPLIGLNIVEECYFSLTTLKLEI